MEILFVIAVVILAAAHIFLSFANRALDRVATDVARPAIGLDFWHNLPPDVRALEFQIEQQTAFLERKLGALKCELRVPADSTRTQLEQARINDRVESAIAGPAKAIRRLHERRAARIEELKERYLDGLDPASDS